MVLVTEHGLLHMKYALTQHNASEIITRIRLLCQVLRSKKKVPTAEGLQ